MNRITPLDPRQATGKTKALFEGVQAKLGAVPNLLRTIGNSSAALEGYLNFSGALAGGKLSAQEREQIALTVAETNLCSYCLSAHTFIGSKLGLGQDEIADARRATATHAKTDAVLKLAAAEARPGARRGTSWMRPMAWAATVGLSLAIVLEIGQVPQPESAAVMGLDGVARQRSNADMAGSSLQAEQADDSAYKRESDVTVLTDNLEEVVVNSPETPSAAEEKKLKDFEMRQQPLAKASKPDMSAAFEKEDGDVTSEAFALSGFVRTQ